MADRIYCGSGKEKTFADGGSIVTVTLNVDEILAQYEAYGFTTTSGKRTIKIKVGRRREIDQYGNSHSVEIDTWKPTNAPQSTQTPHGGNTHPNSQRTAQQPLSGTAEGDDGFTDDIPF